MLKDINNYNDKVNKSLGFLIYKSIFNNAEKKIKIIYINDGMHIIDDNDKKKIIYIMHQIKILANNKN